MKKIKCRLQSGNACHYSVHNLFLFQFDVQNYKGQYIEKHNFDFVLYGCETWSATVSELHRISVFGNRVLRKIFWPVMDVVMGEWGI